MSNVLFGTPVDAKTLAVRPAPETPVVVIPIEHSASVQVFVGLPASGPALHWSEAEALRAYYRWERDDSFWWKTQQPALFSLQQLTRGVWAGHLVEQGAILRAGDDPRQSPDGEGYFFKVSKRPTGEPIRDPHGPAISTSQGDTVEVMTSRATQTVMATFPAFGDDALWIRLFKAGKERPKLVSALLSELHVLGVLTRSDPTMVPPIVHSGVLQTTMHAGHYVASRRPIGVHPNAMLRSARRRNRAAACAGEIALGLVRILNAAHGHGLCVGPITVGMLRVYCGLADSEPRLRVELITAPGAGVPGEVLPPALFDLFPAVDVDGFTNRIEGKYVRSRWRDFEGLGFILEEMLTIAEEVSPELRLVVRSLTGRNDDASEAATALESYVASHRGRACF